MRKYHVHCIAKCQECSWHSEEYKDGQKQASAHAKKTGHHVTGEAAYHFEYNSRIS